MKVKPLFNQILVNPVQESTTLLTPEAVFLNYGEVTAIGEDVTRVKVGDKICFTIWGLNHVEIEGVKHYLVPEDRQFLLGTLVNE